MDFFACTMSFFLNFDGCSLKEPNYNSWRVGALSLMLKRPLDGAALTLILHCSCKQFMKKGRGRVTKSFRTWDKHKGKVTEGFHTISRTKERLSKEENVVENLELPIFTGGFQVENLRWRVQNLLFPSAADMVDQGNQLKRVWECRKWSKSAIKV